MYGMFTYIHLVDLYGFNVGKYTYQSHGWMDKCTMERRLVPKVPGVHSQKGLREDPGLPLSLEGGLD